MTDYTKDTNYILTMVLPRKNSGALIDQFGTLKLFPENTVMVGDFFTDEDLMNPERMKNAGEGIGAAIHRAMTSNYSEPQANIEHYKGEVDKSELPDGSPNVI